MPKYESTIYRGTNKCSLSDKEFEVQNALGLITYHMKHQMLSIIGFASIKALNILSTDEDWRIRFYVTKNPNTPIKTLEKLSIDIDERVRRNVSSNSYIMHQQNLYNTKDKI